MRTIPGREASAATRGARAFLRVELFVLLALLVFLTALPLPAVVYLPLLSLVVMGVGTNFGRRAGALFALLGIGAQIARVHPALDLTGVVVLLTPLAAGLAGGYAGQRLREARLGAERAARRADLLSVALRHLPSLESTQAIYHKLPRLLSDILGFMHADVLSPSPDGSRLNVVTTFGWTPPDDLHVPLESVTGRAFLQQTMQHVPNTAEDPDYFEGPGLGPVHSELALPIMADGRVDAVLNLERAQAGPFAPEEIASLQALVQAVGSAVERVGRLERAHARERFQEFLLDFSRQISDIGSPTALAQQALELLLPRTGADSARLWQPIGRDLHLVSESHTADAAPFGLLPGTRPPQDALFTPDAAVSPYCTAEQLSLGLQSFALLPMLEGEGSVHAVLELLYYRQATSFPSSLREMLGRASVRLSQSLQQAWLTTRLSSLLEALHGLSSVGDPERLPDLALATARQLIPGTDAASLLLLGNGEGLRLAAQLGYGDLVPKHWEIHSLHAAEHWYGGERWQFLRGQPSLLQGDALEDDTGGLRCSLCLPLVHEQDVVGLLSLDSLTREDAFAQVSLSLAETFGMQLSVLLARLSHQRALEQVARTDSLTGLQNRRSFDERIAEVWQAAQRYGHPLALVIVDLLGFKSVNDQHGHQAGDEMLVAVAHAMEDVRREGDSVFRWGGDEFAIILNHADLPGALKAAARYLAAIRSARAADASLADLHVSATLGVASAPRDADSIQDLLKAADDRLFEAKRAKVPIAPQRSA